MYMKCNNLHVFFKFMASYFLDFGILLMMSFIFFVIYWGSYQQRYAEIDENVSALLEAEFIVFG